MAETTASSSRLEELNDIPLADEDATEELSDGHDSSQDQSQEKLSESDSQRYRLDGQSIESISSVYTNGTDSPTAQHSCMSSSNKSSFHLNLSLNQLSIQT